MVRSTRWLVHLAVAAGLFAVPELCAAASITIASATVTQPDSPAGICVGLELEADEVVAGTENLIVWDGACATLLQETCVANPEHGKELSGTLQPQQDFAYKALVLSFTDVDPIPAGSLYCCDFLVHANPGECCQLRVESPGASDPEGNALQTTAGAPGEVCLSADAPTPGASATPTATAAAPTETPAATFTSTPRPTGTSTSTPTRTVAPDSDDDGCAVQAPGVVNWALWVVWGMAALVRLGVRQRQRQR